MPISGLLGSGFWVRGRGSGREPRSVLIVPIQRRHNATEGIDPRPPFRSEFVRDSSGIRLGFVWDSSGIRLGFVPPRPRRIRDGRWFSFTFLPAHKQSCTASTDTPFRRQNPRTPMQRADVRLNPPSSDTFADQAGRSRGVSRGGDQAAPGQSAAGRSKGGAQRNRGCHVRRNRGLVCLNCRIPRRCFVLCRAGRVRPEVAHVSVIGDGFGWMTNCR
jgi:hypothetical protein